MRACALCISYLVILGVSNLPGPVSWISGEGPVHGPDEWHGAILTCHIRPTAPHPLMLDTAYMTPTLAGPGPIGKRPGLPGTWWPPQEQAAVLPEDSSTMGLAQALGCHHKKVPHCSQSGAKVRRPDDLILQARFGLLAVWLTSLNSSIQYISTLPNAPLLPAEHVPSRPWWLEVTLKENRIQKGVWKCPFVASAGGTHTYLGLKAKRPQDAAEG